MNIIYCDNDTPLEGFYRTIKLKTQDFIVPSTSYAGFNRINIFVGSNNSGKSRLLRHMFLSENKFSEIKDDFDSFLFQSVNIRRLFKSFYGDDVIRENIYDYFIRFLEEEYIHPQRTKDPKLQLHNTMSEELWNLLYSSKSASTTKITSKNMYIPLLRGLHPIEIMNEEKGKPIDFIFTAMYRKRTIKQYFKSFGNDCSEDLVFTGQGIYEKLQDMLLGDRGERETVREYEKFLSKYIFEGKSITLIPKKKSDTVWVRIGDLPERKIHNLGDGIQALILLTFPIYMNKEKDMMFFIEEPEINMHPGMQRIFMNALVNFGFDKHHYFFTTHSNNFIDMAFDYESISIFMFHKSIEETDDTVKEVFKVENVNCGDIRILREIGVNNSSVFMSNCSIWVEGITDRMYIREYLIRYQMKEFGEILFTEDLHYSFVEYGGSSVAHLEYKNSDEAMINKDNINIKSISNKPILVADFDGKAKEHQHEQRLEKLGESHYYVLKNVKEIENTLHENILKRVIADYENVKDITELNFKDLDNFKQKKYKNKPLGQFINDSLQTKSRATYADKVKKQVEKDGKTNNITVDGNTILDKVSFAEKACIFLRDDTILYDDAMSESSTELAKKLCEFIEKSNETILNI